MKARASDPVSSHLAATAVKPGAGVLEAMIVAAVWRRTKTAEQIASHLDKVCPGRWHEGTVRTAVSRVAEDGRIVVVGEGRTSRGRVARLYRATGEEQ